MYTIYRKLIVSSTQKHVWSHRWIKRTLRRTSNMASKHRNRSIACRACCKQSFRPKLQPSPRNSAHWAVHLQADRVASVWAVALVLAHHQATTVIPMIWAKTACRQAVARAVHQPVLVVYCHHFCVCQDQFCRHHPNRQLVANHCPPHLMTIPTNKQFTPHW